MIKHFYFHLSFGSFSSHYSRSLQNLAGECEWQIDGIITWRGCDWNLILSG
jgi:hypothetical protein